MRNYACDLDGRCPYITDESQSTGMYFCRENCGLGIEDDYDPFEDWHGEDDAEDEDDEDDAPDEPDDSNLEVGYDPYLGCYTDDC